MKGLDEAVEIERLRSAISGMTGKQVVYDAQGGVFRSDNQTMKIAKDPLVNAYNVEIEGKAFSFEYDPLIGKYVPLE